MIAQGNVSFANVPILAYHKITQAEPSSELGGYAVSVCRFERQMRYLHDHGCRCLSLIDLLRVSGKKDSRRERFFALTFDDGYEDFCALAYPILRRHQFTATVFLVTDYIGGRSNWEGEMGTPLLTWEQVRTLHRGGITFGSHTCTHPRLTWLSNERCWQELAVSKERLEAELNSDVTVLAYPYGESSMAIQKVAEAVGYQAACGSATGRAGRFNLWRRPCRAGDRLLSFSFQLSSCYHYSMTLRRWLREETAPGRYLRELKHNWFDDQRRHSTWHGS